MEKFLKSFEKLLYFRSVLFLWSILLYGDAYCIYFFHKSIINFNYESLKSLKILTIGNIFIFLLFFSVIYVFIIPLINFLMGQIWIEFYYSKYNILYKNEDINDFYIDQETLKEYAIIHDNKVLYDIYKEHIKSQNENEELDKISIFVIIFSIIDYVLSIYNKGICILKILETNKLHVYLISGYIILLVVLIINIFNGYVNNKSMDIILSREITSHIIDDVKKFNSKAIANPPNNEKVMINPDDFKR